jgi:hypothetical protein
MLLLLDIKDNKADSLIDVLNGLKYVKIKPLTSKKYQLIDEIKEAVVNLELIKSGNMKAKTLDELLNEF